MSTENAFEQKKKKPGSKFNLRLALIGLRTTGPRIKRNHSDFKKYTLTEKLSFKHPTGLVKDGSKTLRELNVTNGVKMMVVGSTMNDVMKVTPPPPGALKEEKIASGTSRTMWDKR